MKSLIIGNGQIGSALLEIFSKNHETHSRDLAHLDCPGVEVLHIAYPYSEDFVRTTRQYTEQYKPQLTIIHSSVAVGTTAKCGDRVVHAPERGRFPNLAKEMIQFPKFVGGYELADVTKACVYFRECGWSAVPVLNPCITELLKLQSNVHLGLEIAWRQEIERVFHSFGIGQEEMRFYEKWEDSYNAGHLALGHHQLLRPRMRPDPIGGHCILPCTDILASQFFSKAFDFIRSSNAKRQTEISKPASN